MHGAVRLLLTEVGQRAHHGDEYCQGDGGVDVVHGLDEHQLLGTDEGQRQGDAASCGIRCHHHDERTVDDIAVNAEAEQRGSAACQDHGQHARCELVEQILLLAVLWTLDDHVAEEQYREHHHGDRQDDVSSGTADADVSQ